MKLRVTSRVMFFIWLNLMVSVSALRGDPAQAGSATAKPTAGVMLSVYPVVVDQFVPKFRPGSDLPIPGPNHPPFDQIPPMEMPRDDGPARETLSNTTLFHDAVTGKTTEMLAGETIAGWADGLQGGEPEYKPTDVDFSDEMLRSFGLMTLATDLGNFPRSANVKLLMHFVDPANNDVWRVCSGSMGDPGVVVTAAHCVYKRDLGFPPGDGRAWAREIWVYPAWDGNGTINPPDDVIKNFGWARGTCYIAGSDYINNGNWERDAALIRLGGCSPVNDTQRSMGMLTSWFGWATGGPCFTVIARNFHNYSYPSEDCLSDGLHNGRDMYYWNGNFDSCLDDRRFQISTVGGCYHAGWGGMSGSGAYYVSGDTRYVQAVSSTSNRSSWARYCELWPQFITDMQAFENDTRTSTFDLEALKFRVGGSTTVRAGNSLPDSSVQICNATNNDPPSNNYTLTVRLSANNNISATDMLLATLTYNNVDFGAIQCWNFNVASPDIPANFLPGTYWIGVVLDPGTDVNIGNNSTDTWDAQQITVTVSCGDGICNGNESTCNCQLDCGTTCGDGCCKVGESACNCPQDCATVCGDGCCTGSETACNCATECTPVCGDGCCNGNETCVTCPEDGCTPTCGDEVCECGEDGTTCPADCLGACCVPSGETFDCSGVMTEPECGVYWARGQDCSTVVCSQACCNPLDGTCLDLPLVFCSELLSWNAEGPDTSCAVDGCSSWVYQACCNTETGICTVGFPEDCVALGTVPQGPNTHCRSYSCPQPPQACCLPNGTCGEEMIPSACEAADGIPQGSDKTCSSPDVDCLRACCLDQGGCAEDTPIQACGPMGGQPLAAHIMCNDPSVDCSAPRACCCEDLMTGETWCEFTRDCIDVGEAVCDAGPAGSSCSTYGCIPEACCYSNGTCSYIGSGRCEENGGTPQGSGSSCGSVDCSLAEACCLPDGTCSEGLTPNACGAAGGIPQGLGKTCSSSDVDCLRACCLFEGGCVEDTPVQACGPLGGEPLAPHVMCVDTGVDCSPIHACCCEDIWGENWCETTRLQCFNDSDTVCYAGQDGSRCSGHACIPEACCHSNGTCSNLVSGECEENRGIPQGSGTSCGTVDCPQPEACCFDDTTCAERTADYCQASGGVLQGEGTVCADITCPDRCGNGVCGPNEDCCACPEDCGECAPGDGNGDGHVDLQDLDRLVYCMSGPEVLLGSWCRCFDLDRDNDVDMQDFDIYQRAFEGP